MTLPKTEKAEVEGFIEWRKLLLTPLCLRFSLLDSVSAGCHNGEWPGGGVREQPVGSLLAWQEGCPAR